MIAASLTVIGLGGLPGRFPPQVVAYAQRHWRLPSFSGTRDGSDIDQDDPVRDRSGASQSAGDLLVWGDSARKVDRSIDPNALSRARQAGRERRPALRPLRCSTMRATIPFRSGAGAAYNRAVVEHVERNRVPNVLLAAFWGTYPVAFDPANPNADEIQCPLDEELLKTVQQLQAAGALVWIMRQIPTYMANVPRVLAISALKGEPPRQVDHPLQWHRDWLIARRPVRHAGDQGVVSLDPVDLLLDNESLLPE